MNVKTKQFMKNIIGAVGANVVRLIISVVLTLLLPKLMGQEQYSYWQLYLFYGTYLAYTSLGWCEGFTLKYGGAVYDRLDKPLIIGQIWMLFGYEILFFFGLWLVISIIGIPDPKYVLLLTACASAIFDIIRYMVQSVLHTVNRISEYVRIVLLERLLFAGLAAIALILGYNSALSLIFCEILGRFLSMLYSFGIIRDMVKTRPAPVKAIAHEAKSEISIGCKLLWALLASQLVIGIIRFAIEQKWGVLQFGQISLTISLSNMVVTCVSAIGVVIFPMLKRMENEQMERIYTPTRMMMSVLIWGVMLFFAPLKWMLTAWLPQYAGALDYLALLLPLCLYESRTAMLTTTYLKAYREEKNILLSNVIAVALSIVVAGLTVFLAESLTLAVLAITLLCMVKAYLTEFFVCRHLSFPLWRELIIESILMTLFMLSGWYLGYLSAMCLYASGYILYLIAERKHINKGIDLIKQK
ncbi:MAG: hypothetical protein IIX93_00965 [Clostridia bacterium]|nr:hypothetical protein [Clostridia bacterium]